MYQKFLTFVLACAIFLQTGTGILSAEPFPGVEFAAEELKPTELYAKSAVLMDGDSGRVLYEKDGYAAMANASTTKILTCILTLENCDLDSEVEVSALAASQPKVHLGMSAGQKFYMRDLLYGLMLESFNDCAMAIAEHIGGTKEGFAEMMNRKAKEIGCKDTYFITPNGLDAKDSVSFHHTTAADLAGIMRYCLKESEKAEAFLEITRTKQYSFTDLEGKRSYSCYNRNAFLDMMEGALSGKTGFTGNAGYCYVGALEREGKTYIVALLACGWPNNKTYKWSDTKKLMNYGLENFEKKYLSEIRLDPSELEPVPVEEGQGGRIGEAVYIRPLVEERPGIEELLVFKGQDITVSCQMAEKLQAPVEKGAYIGKVTYRLGEETLKECAIRSDRKINKIDFSWCFWRVMELFELF